jgi:hypothetical protein
MRRPRHGWELVVLASFFLTYFGVQLYCDFRRPEPFGAVVQFHQGQATLSDIADGSAASRAGLRPGDQILAVNGIRVRSWLDWMTIESNIEPDRPIAIEIQRGASRSRVMLALEWSPWANWRSEGGFLLGTVRAAQFISLVLAFLIAVRRPADPVTRTGVWLLATLGIFSIVLPARFSIVWRALPPVVSLILWPPFISNVAIGAIFFTFFAVFPRRLVRSTSGWFALWTPMAAGLAWYAWYGYESIYNPIRASDLPDFTPLLIMGNLTYLTGGVSTLLLNYRRLNISERRRVRVLMFGVTSGTLAGVPLAVAYWVRSRADLAHSSYLASPAFALGTFLILLLPLSLSYAVLRHRLFDLRLIIRLGVRYALARGFLLALVPALSVAFLIDLLAHGKQPLLSVLNARGWVYGLLGTCAVWAAVRRQDWLDSVDRRFFREKYDAHRLLAQVAVDLRSARGIGPVAPKVVRPIEAALHPEFVAFLVRLPDEPDFQTLVAAPSDRAQLRIPSSSTVIRLMRVLQKPLDVTIDDTSWILKQLHQSEAELLQTERIALLVPVAVGPDRIEVMLALGVKRSEEPYSEEDLDLLITIANALALSLELAPPPPSRNVFEECPLCGTCYDSGTACCAIEGADLVTTTLPRVLDGRYRLTRRLGAGGMGTVYAATDSALERPVATKLIRVEIAENATAIARFQREARAAASFTHPNVVTVHDFGVAGGAHAFLVMELLEGSTLRQELRRHGAQSISRSLEILRGVCSAVDAAHRQHLIHRDLKPENIFLARSDRGEVAKILDFGVAKSVRAEAFPESGLTGGGMLLGTLEYMAPEQLRGEETQPAWDIWALGLVAFETLAGIHPFAGVDLSLEHYIDYRALITDRLPGALSVSRSLFCKTLALNPHERPSSAGAMFDELQHVLKDHAAYHAKQ